MLFLWLEQVVELQQQLAVQYRELDQVLRLRDSLLFEAEVAQQLREEDEEEPINEIDMEVSYTFFSLTEAGWVCRDFLAGDFMSNEDLAVACTVVQAPNLSGT